MWISADSEKIRYTGRIDWSVPKENGQKNRGVRRLCISRGGIGGR